MSLFVNVCKTSPNKIFENIVMMLCKTNLGGGVGG